MKIAAVQATPVFNDIGRSVEKAHRLISAAAKEGADLVVFPEAFLSGYPFWVWHIPSGRSKAIRPLYAKLVENAVDADGEVVAGLCSAARDAGVSVVMGINERNTEASGTSLYNSVLYISHEGELLGKHRKLVPTVGERFVYAQGDGSTLEAFNIPGARIGGLICWENYMPLARFTMYAQGVQVYIAPTWDNGEPWQSTLRHIAKEGRVWVIGCCSVVRKEDAADPSVNEFLSGVGEWINPGDSVIVDPDGKVVAGPLRGAEGILYADVDASTLTGPRYQLDVAGHYARPDIFSLSVDRREKRMLED